MFGRFFASSRQPFSIGRRTAGGVGSVEQLEKRQVLSSAVSSVVDASGELTIDNFAAPQRSLYTGEALSKPSSSGGGKLAVQFVQNHAADFGLNAADVASPIVTDQYADEDTGITHVYLRQSYKGLPVMTADMVVNLMPDGSVISAAGGFIANLAQAAKGVKGPKVTAGGALLAAAQQLKLTGSTAFKTLSAATSGDYKTVLSAPALSQTDVQAVLRYVPTADGLTLAWSFNVNKPDNSHWYDLAVGGDNSAVVFASDWVDHASYNVVARPNSSPQDGGFSVVTDPQDTLASPYGWHDTNGAAGAEYTTTRGNNVDSHLDRNADNVADAAGPSGGAALDFTGASFTQAPASEPTVAVNQAVAQTNLFYAVNTAHDLTYKYGFTEAAGNFQVNNYGRGGTAGDAVQADAQDGSGTNNANFATPADGQAGRMQMYLFTDPTPDRDGDLDMDVIYHEFGHGVSNRLTGGPANANALNALQSGGMGEGWSDFLALMFVQRATDTQNGGYGVGTYVLNQSPDGLGIRRFKYSYDMAVNPLTIDAYGSGGSGGGTFRSLEVHDTGEIWTSALWDMNWNLINKYGFESNLANGFNAAAPKGNSLALKLVLDAMKLQPANPSFKDARDAILQADANLHATLGTPLNTDEIYAAFARRGMGAGFVSGTSSSTSVTPSYVVPLPDPTVVGSLPVTSYGPFSTVTVQFDQPMNTGSFAVADDVVSFTGPGGTNVVPSIASFTWVDSTTLRLNLSPAQVNPGAYSLVIGPNILAADDGHGLDSDRDGTPGETVDDRATIGITLITSVGPDNYGYQTAPFPYESINLVLGGTGVTTLVNGSDDGAAAVALGSNTFNFYGTTYTGSTLFANSNGLITFDSATTSYVNDGFNPGAITQAAIAPAWADFRTDTTGSGATDSAVLYKLDTANNRLIIEWSDVTSYYGSGVATFQAILQLNTGATPGRIIYNYVDTDIGPADPFNNIDTVGIKAAGTLAATNRLPFSYNTATPWVASGRALLTALDVTPPKITAESFNYTANQSFTVTFNEDVGASLSIADFVLANTTVPGIISGANLSLTYNAATRTATITNIGPRLANANYTLTTVAAGVTDAAGNPLDGDADNIIGGNHVFSTFVLAGDANRDRKTDFNDFLILQANFNTNTLNFAAGDFNYDGVVDFNDFLVLQANFGKTV